jgi:triose/dihydroxyacetone kinase / FAD-AMP lyase (cyclizing)
MAGVSLSVMHLDERALARLDAPTDAPAWPRSLAVPELGKPRQPLCAVSRLAAADAGARAQASSRVAALEGRDTPAERLVRACVRACCDACIAAEPEMTRQDTLAGDGDCGTTIKAGAQAIRAHVPWLPLHDLSAGAAQLAAETGRSMGGTSGALYSIFFTAAAHGLQGLSADSATPVDWAEALDRGTAAIKRYGQARAGDRSMVDALEPAAVAARSCAGLGMVVAESASDAAAQGADATKAMAGRAGRSGYVTDAVLAGVVDPGAFAVATWIQAIAATLAAHA